jgi:TolA-binding protein
MFRRICACLLIASPAVVFGADKTMMELQRDMSNLQDQIKALQRSQDERFAKLEVLVQQALGSSTDANKSVYAIQTSLQQSLRDTQDKVVPPVAALSTRMDQMAENLGNLEGAVKDLNSSLNKIQTQLTDVKNALTVLQTPAPAPPAQPGAPPGGSAIAAPAMPPMSAMDMYANAQRDYSGGQLDLALQEFTEYLKYYDKTAQAPAAQFYIGYIHYSQKDYETAAQDFDAVLEKYSDDNVKAPDAAYYKGLSLKQIPGHLNDAVKEFLQLIKDYPNNENAKKACTQLQSVGRNCPGKVPAKAPAKKTTKK